MFRIVMCFVIRIPTVEPVGHDLSLCTSLLKRSVLCGLVPDQH